MRSKLLTIFLLIAILMPALVMPQAALAASPVFVNELHYDNAGTDTGEAIEIAGPAGTDLTGWSIVLYNGNGGASYNTNNLGGSIPDHGSGFGTVVVNYPSNGIQNGSPDGIALVDSTNAVVQFLSYEGSFTAVGGPAGGMTSTDIGVAEGSSTPAGNSLQLTGTGSVYADFTWSSPSADNFGAVNTGQTFAAAFSPPFVNELHYDNAGADSGEGIEVAGQSGMDLTGWSIVLYNGNGGASYGTISLSGLIPDLQNGYGTLWFAQSGIQNGSPDGFALVDPSSNVLQFLSYEGTFTAVDGPAVGMTSTDIGVAEGSSTPAGNTLQLTGSGSVYEDFTWANAQPNTLGAVNTNQTFSIVTTVTDPVINEFSASTTGADVEYIEVFGDPSTDYSAFTVLELEGDSSKGNIDRTFPVGTTNAGGFWTTSVGSLSIENGSITLLLVEGFTGSVGNDLDTDNDGTFDSTPWTRIVDDVAVFDGGAGDLTYSSVALGPNYDGLSTFPPGGASRIPNGIDTDTVGDWARNDFDLFGIPGFPGSPALGEAENTPDAVNVAITVLTDPVGVCGDAATLIHDIQASGLVSPDVGSIREVEGVVVGDFQGSTGLSGFFLQEEDVDTDADDMTSEGIFVFDAVFEVDVDEGDIIRVRGTVAEFYDLTEINNIINVAACGSGASVTSATVTLPVASISDLEAFEGMAITFPQQLTVTETYTLGRYGQVSLSVNGRLPNPTHIAAPGAAANAQEDLNDRSRIELDDGNTWQNKDPITHPFPGLSASNTLRGGSTVTGLVGVLDYSHDIYRVQPVDDVIFSNDNPRPAFPTAVGGTLKVASFNVLNYFNGDGLGGGFPTPRGAESASEFTRQRVKIVTAILTMDADVIGLMEIENDGYGTESAIADLVNGLNDVAGAGTYAYIDPGVSAIGTDAIAVGFIYKPATVTLIGASAILDASVDPTFNDDKNRPALAQTFQENATAGRFTAVVNHFKSKGSDCNSLGDPDIGDGQGNCNLTRTSAAVALANWLATDPTSSNDPDYLILGDLNSYAMEDPISALTSAGYTDLAASLIGSSAFSYVFAGEWGYLDYAMSNGSLTAQVTGVTEWHINADEPPVLDYNENYKSAGQITSLYSPDAYRASDHDPVVIGLELTIEQEVNELIDAVQALVDDGTLNGGQGNALTKKLENVLAKLAKGNTNAAANQLDAFINQVEAFVNGGILTAEQGDALIEAATALVEVLSN